MPTKSSLTQSKGTFKKIQFTVDAALLRELGERLVGKPHVALAELVKNSYDADARKCRIVFTEDAIEVMDNGNGMTLDEFQNFWMRVGTTHKQRTSTSARFKRIVTGSKGVGRLSVQFLGNQFEMWTISLHGQIALHARVDWSGTHQLGDLTQASAEYRLEPPDGKLSPDFKHGTKLVIRGLNQKWEENSLRDLARELWFLQPPKVIRKNINDAHRFEVELQGAGEDAMLTFQNQMRAALTNWTAQIDGSLKKGRDGVQANVKVKFKTGEEFEHQYSIPYKMLNEAKFSIKVFNLSGRQADGISVPDARAYFKRYGGVHVYDDGFRLPFYGGEEQDWLRLEIDHSHRLMISKLLPDELQVSGGMRDLPTLGRVFGTVEVSTSSERSKAPPQDQERGEYLNIQVTRDRLIDNKPFEDLQYLVRWAFDYYANRVAELKQKNAATEITTNKPRTETVLLNVRTALAHAEPHVPKKEFKDIQVRLDELEQAEIAIQETLEKERILLGALATAGMSAVALEHELGKEITALSESVKRLRRIAKGELQNEISAIAHSLECWIERASGAKLLFSPLMNVSDREQREKLKAAKVIQRIALQMKPLLRNTVIEIDDIPADLRLPRGTMAGWNAIFQNVLMNAVNAMLEQKTKRIRCHAGSLRKRSFIIIEDTGVGVDLDNSEDLFKPFVRKLNISEERRALGLGGVGLGLTIVKMVATSLNCETSFVKPIKSFKSAFKLEWEEKS